MLLRHYLEQGVPKAEIARRVGVSRRTVTTGSRPTSWTESSTPAAPARYGPRCPAPSKLDPYKAIIDERLATYPKLSATRLYREVRESGYEGSYSQVKRYARQVRPRPEPEPERRFETPPGHQGQVDFADFALPWGKRHALVVVLGCSRMLWLQYYERQTMATVVRGLEAAFAFFGGVPSALLFDQMRAVVVGDHRSEGGRLLESGQRPGPRHAEAAARSPLQGRAASAATAGGAEVGQARGDGRAASTWPSTPGSRRPHREGTVAQRPDRGAGGGREDGQRVRPMRLARFEFDRPSLPFTAMHHRDTIHVSRATNRAPMSFCSPRRRGGLVPIAFNASGETFGSAYPTNPLVTLRLVRWRTAAFRRRLTQR